MGKGGMLLPLSIGTAARSVAPIHSAPQDEKASVMGKFSHAFFKRRHLGAAEMCHGREALVARRNGRNLDPSKAPERGE